MSDDYQPFSSYADLVRLISELCAGGSTGSLFAISEINSLAKVVIVAGNIIYIEYRLKKGAEAIPLFLEIESGSYDFKAGKVISHKATQLPPTAELLAQLSGDASVAAAPPPVAAPAAGAHASPEAFKVIEEQLIEILGPMGSFVWEEHLEQAGGPNGNVDVIKLIDDVATEIDDPKKAAQFRSHLFNTLK
ncbi:DUF4388 domain-containing protein [Thiosocius teredinicola]|uniref:DUF4388 domain-containing protein n=1 Tax=Thiosocius teredinicola TaxID=1973002 RepID=UPI000990DDEB